MSAKDIEAFLARLYLDSAACSEFLANPAEACLKAGLSREDTAAMMAVDRVGLRLSSRAVQRKVERKRRFTRAYLAREHGG